MAAPSSSPPCSLSALGMANALGCGHDEIWPRLLAGDQTQLRVRRDLVPGRALLVGEVRRALPQIPASLRRYACRNNALTLAALEPIESAVPAQTSMVAKSPRNRGS